MRLVFLYVHKGRFPSDAYFSDGYHSLFQHLTKNKIVDEVAACWIDYCASNTITLQDKDNYSVKVYPAIKDLDIRPDDIIWVRGGWKSWIPLLEKCNKNKQWLLYYGANTGHERWPYWDIVLNDMTEMKGVDARERYWLPFQKPIAEIFSYSPRTLSYDVCLGASHIFHRKGQYNSFEIVKKYKEIFGIDLNCIMPGSFYGRDVRTMQMRKELPQHKNIKLPGFLPRKDVANILNCTKIYIHMGGGGQNDRSVLEAGLCGCHIMLASAKYHPPWIDNDPAIVYTSKQNTDYVGIAKRLHDILPQAVPERKKHIADYFEKKNGMLSSVIPLFKELFSFLRANPKVNVKLMEDIPWKNW